MSPQISPQLSPQDEALLLRLARIAQAVDPAPDIVYELGRAALTLRLLDEELAMLVSDSATELSLVRGPAVDTRLLAFELADLSIETQVSFVGGHRALMGQVIPEPVGIAAWIVVESVEGGSLAPAAVDDLGRFTVPDVPEGLVRLHLRRGHLPTVVTSWVRI